MTPEDRAQVLLTIDRLGVALAGHGHQWTDEERTAYETTIGLLLAVPESEG